MNLTQAVLDKSERIRNAKQAGRKYILALASEGAAKGRLVSGNGGLDDKRRWANAHATSDASYGEFYACIQALGDQTGYSSSLALETEHAAGVAYRTALFVACREIGGSE